MQHVVRFLGKLRNWRSLVFAGMAATMVAPGAAQEWAWMGTTAGAPVYGTAGVASATNSPGSRNGACGWSDTSGNLWMFGGAGNGNWMNDLWKYNIASGNWTFVKGYTTPNLNGDYGTVGVPADSNMPGARTGMAAWTDLSGNFWGFGGDGHTGFGEGRLNDLWRYDVGSNQWTWMKGSNGPNATSVLGTQGVAAAANTPGARQGMCTWVDKNGDFWLFGGNWAYPWGQGSLSNDLWKYDIETNNWTWMSGSDLYNQPGHYGTKGVADQTNCPGARWAHVGWTDADGNLWLFGGNGYGGSQYGTLNDLWKYDVSSGLWTWMGGSDGAIDQSGVYGSKGVTAASNVPGAHGFSFAKADAHGNFYLFGGGGAAASGTGYLNDLWKYSPGTGNWTWVAGGDAPGQDDTLGALGVASPANTPGARASGPTWHDGNGNLWLYGGYGPWGFQGSLWKLAIAPVVGPADLKISKTVSDGPYVTGKPFDYTLTVTNQSDTTATGVTVVDELPSVLSLLGVRSTQGWLRTTGNKLEAELAEIGANASAVITVIAQANERGDVTNTATVSSESDDPNLSNNVDSVTIRAVGSEYPHVSAEWLPGANGVGLKAAAKCLATLAVSNDGLSESPALTVNCYLSSNNAYDVADSLLVTKTLAHVKGKSTKTLRIAPLPGEAMSGKFLIAVITSSDSSMPQIVTVHGPLP